MARGQREGRRLHRLGKLALEIRLNHPVVRRDDVPRRFRLPGDVGDPCAEDRAVGGALRGEDQLLLGERQILREVLEHALHRHREIALGVRAHFRESGRRREVLAELTDRLADIWGEGRHVDQPGDLWIGAGLGDHHAAPRVADENDRPVLQRDGALRGGHVVGERSQRILHRHNVQPRLLEERNHLGPARSVGPRTVHENHVAHAGRLFVGGEQGGCGDRQGKCCCEDQSGKATHR